MVLVQFQNDGISVTSITDEDDGPTILELQGVLEFTSSDEASSDNLILGDFTVDGSKAELTIGHHKLEGKRVKLSKPLVLLDLEDSAKSGLVKMQNVIRYKYLFNIRPRHYSTAKQ